jgi:hypothetical protein
MRTALNVLLLFFVSSLSLAQAPPAPAAMPAATGNSISMTPILSDLDRLQAAATQANLDLGHLRIEKWKTDNASREQAQSNADSVQRNLTTALPGLISNVRGAPQDVNAEFKLYRNLNVLYDVFASLTESVGAFGPRGDYDALAQQLNIIDSVRRNLGDALEKLTSSTQSELAQLRTEVQTLQQRQAAAATAVPPKKVVVDDTEPARKTSSHKKKAATSASTTSTESTSGETSNTGNAPKQQ